MAENTLETFNLALNDALKDPEKMDPQVLANAAMNLDQIDSLQCLEDSLIDLRDTEKQPKRKAELEVHIAAIVGLIIASPTLYANRGYLNPLKLSDGPLSKPTKSVKTIHTILSEYGLRPRNLEAFALAAGITKTASNNPAGSESPTRAAALRQ